MVTPCSAQQFVGHKHKLFVNFGKLHHDCLLAYSFIAWQLDSRRPHWSVTPLVVAVVVLLSGWFRQERNEVKQQQHCIGRKKKSRVRQNHRFCFMIATFTSMFTYGGNRFKWRFYGNPTRFLFQICAGCSFESVQNQNNVQHSNFNKVELDH